MKKTLFSAITLLALALGTSSLAACPYTQKASPCDNPCEQRYENPCDKPCKKEKKCNPCDNLGCGEEWLSYSNLQEYFCQMGFTDCQKEEAMNAIEEFKCQTSNIRANNCQDETKCDCRAYKRALKDLDCKMKKIITDCQKDEYKDIRQSVKDQVKCTHKCMTSPFGCFKKCSCQ